MWKGWRLTIRVRFGVLDCRREFSGGVPGESGGTVVQRIPGGIVVVDLRDRACHILQAITIRSHGIRVIRAARLGIGAIAVGVIAPELKAGVVGLADETIQPVIIIGAVIYRIGVGCLSDATGSIISQRADIVADAMGFEPAIDVETACTSARFPHIKLSRFGSNQFTDDASLSGLFATCC
jgi:hypothetical protein